MEQGQGDWGRGFLRAGGGRPEGVPAVSPHDSSGNRRGAPVSRGCVRPWPIAGAKSKRVGRL